MIASEIPWPRIYAGGDGEWKLTHPEASAAQSLSIIAACLRRMTELKEQELDILRRRNGAGPF